MTREKARIPLVLVLGSLTALGPLSIDMYLPSLPALQRDLGTSASLTQLTLAAYFAGLGLGQLVYGPLSDRFGRKRPLYAGLAIYVLASIACAASPTVHALIALRFVQALGGAAGQVVTRAVVRDLHVGAAAARMLAMLMLVMGVAPILAPLLGGWVLLVAGWRSIFGVLASFGLACLVLMVVSLPETTTTRVASLDVAGIKKGIGLILRDRGFVTYTLTGAFAQAGMFAYISGSPFVFIEIFHVSPQAYGWLFGANAVGLIGASQVNHRMLARTPPTSILAGSTVAIAVGGGVLLAVAVAAWGGLPAMAVALFAFVTCIGFIGSNASALAMEEQGARAGLASAVLGAAQLTIAATASSMVGLLNDATARPMAGIMAVCGVASMIARRAAPRRAARAEGNVRALRGGLPFPRSLS